MVKNWRDSVFVDSHLRQKSCQHKLIRDGGYTFVDTLICSVCKCRWTEGDTRENFACHCEHHGPHAGAQNHTELGWADVLAMFQKQESVDALVSAAVVTAPTTVN